MRVTLFCLATMLLTATAAPPTMPVWLAPYPGADPTSVSTPTGAIVTYTTHASPEVTLAHYRSVFSSAGVAFQPNHDGIGTAISASTPECRLLITIREESSGTRVRAVCAAPSPPGNLSGAAPVEPTSVSRLADLRRPSSQSRGTEEARRRAWEDHERTMAEYEARSRQRTGAMRKYDKPVYPDSSTSRPFSDNDAPPLEWPSWLVATGTSQPVRPVARNANGQRQLEFSYRTTVPMTDIYQFYEDLLKANGFRVHNASLATGHTITRIVQNRDGYVEGTRSENGKVNGPRTIVRASFGRTYLNEPITVRLSIRVKGSFGRR